MSIEFTDYNRITDVLMYLNDSITLNFTVGLSKKSKTGERQFFQYESQYNSGDYQNSILRSIKRNMNFYFTIDIKEYFTASMILRPQDVEMLLIIIEQKILPWFFGTADQSAFQLVNNVLALKEFNPVPYYQSDNKYLVFTPEIISYEDGTSERGIKMELACGESVLFNLDKFMGFIHLLKSDMYVAATNLVLYAKTPPYGINTFNAVGMGASTKISNDNWTAPNYNGQGGAKSFLDNIKAKEGDR